MKQSEADPVVDEIREVRHRISARVHHEPVRLVAYYMELQKRYRDRLVAAEEPALAVAGDGDDFHLIDVQLKSRRFTTAPAVAATGSYAGPGSCSRTRRWPR